MLAGLLFRVLREPFKKAFVRLPPLPVSVSLPAEVNGLRFSLMRALQGMRAAALQQFGKGGLYESYAIGYTTLHPVIAIALITHGWVVTATQPHWIQAVVHYRLSATGLAVENQLEAWWAKLTLEQRLRAVLLE